MDSTVQFTLARVREILKESSCKKLLKRNLVVLSIWILQASKGQLEEKLQEVLAKFETMEKELADVNQQYHSLQQEGDSVDAQARAEKKVCG